jgi:hypothetical protein
MRSLRKDNFAAATLAACVLGLVMCPFPYIGIGALFSFPPAFSFLALPPFLAGSAFLLWRFLSKPADRAMNMLLLILEGISWIAIGAFLIPISGFNLQTGFERFGLSSAFFLLATICCLPLALMRKTALEQRLARLPDWISITALLVILALSGLAVVVYLLKKPAFI